VGIIREFLTRMAEDTEFIGVVIEFCSIILPTGATMAAHISKYPQAGRELFGFICGRRENRLELHLNERKKKMEQVFLSLGFHEELIGGERYLVYRHNYCKVTYLEFYSAFVIEWTDSYEEAEKKRLEDDDLYYLDVPEDVMLQTLREDLKKYYMNNNEVRS